MKKRILSILLAAIMIVSLLPITAFAEPPATVPTVTDVSEAGYDVSKYVLVLYFDEPITNDVVWTGTYNEWSTNVGDMIKFVALEGFSGWYVAQFEDGSSPCQGKIFQLMNDGSFNASFQSGDAEAWIDMAQTLTKHMSLDISISGEITCTLPEKGVYIYEMTKFIYPIIDGTPESAKETNHGYISIDKTTAVAGETVTVTVTADEGYPLKTLKYNDGTDHEITADAQGAYKFTMPASDVTVVATFETTAASLSFDLCNGTEVLTEKPETPTWGDYKFAGWYTAPTGGNKVESGFTTGTTYYAHWQVSETNTNLVLTEGVRIKENGKLYIGSSETAATAAELAPYGLAFTAATTDPVAPAKLTMNNATIETADGVVSTNYYYALHSEAELEIELQGDNRIARGDNNTENSHVFGIRLPNHQLTITSSSSPAGTLTVKAGDGSYGSCAIKCGELVNTAKLSCVAGSTTFTDKKAAGNTNGVFGIYSDGQLTNEEGAEISVLTGDTDSEALAAIGIRACTQKGIYLLNKGKITVTAGNAPKSSSCAIESYGTLQNEKDAVLIATAGNAVEESCGIMAKAIINSGTMTGTMGETEKYGAGIAAETDITVTGGTVTSYGPIEADYYEDGSGTITAEGATVTGTDTEFTSGSTSYLEPKTAGTPITITVAPAGIATWGALQDAIDKATASPTTIQLTQDLTAPATGTSITIPEGKDITLDLNGFTIDRGLSGKEAIADGNVITVKGTLTLNDSSSNKTGKITGGNISGGNGGGVYVNSGTFTMTGGDISNNIADLGGGVYVADGIFTMTGGDITDNTATSGGGVYVYTGIFTMSGGTITGNTATNFGGGVDVNVNAEFTMSENGKIAYNTGKTSGGVYAAGTFNMKGGSIDHNTATAYCGGVIISANRTTLGGTAKITDNVLNSTTKTTNNLYLPNGKTVTLGTGTDAPQTGENGMKIGVTTQTAPAEGAPVQITTNGAEAQKACFTPDNAGYEVAFNNNHLELKVISSGVSTWSALQDAIEKAPGNATTPAAGTTLIQLTDDLTAPETGGASITIPNGKDITLDLNGHVLNANGGVFSVIKVEEGGKLTLIDSAPETEHYFNVDATTGLWTLTGAKTETTKTVKGGVITGGKGMYCGVGMGTNGGGVSVYGTFNMTAGNIVSNKAILSDDGESNGTGGGVLVSTGGVFTMKGGKISDNTADCGGGVFVNTGCTFTMEAGTISGNTASQGGGVNNNHGIFTMKGGEISGNTVQYGGGVMNYGTFKMKSGTISSNKATQYGGGVMNSATFTMEGGTISGNTASQGGGVYSYSGTVTLSGTAKITGNGAQSGGGVYNAGGSTFTMTDGTITGNEVTYGGGVYNKGTFTMTGGTISSNEATQYGGGVSNYGTFTMTGGTMTGNTAVYGGGLDNSGTFTMENGEISGNEVTKDGGAVYVNAQYTFTMKAGEISGNTATRYGGAVYVTTGGTFTMENGKISGNKGQCGGGVTNLATFTMKAGEISNNEATIAGGAVYVNTNSTFTMKSGEITGNDAPIGGGVYSSGTFTMTDGAVSDNEATQYGGGVYNSGTFTMTDGAVSGNEAGYGGGVYNYATFTMTGGEITGNNAETGFNEIFGGGVCTNGTTFIGGTAKITGNTKGTNGTTNNLELVSGTTVTLGTGTDAPADGMSVGVTMATPGTFTGTATDTQKGYFSSDNSGYEVAFNNGHLELKVISGVAKIGDKTYETFAEAIADAKDGDELKLLKDMTITEQLVINKAITFNGNGKTITRTPNAGAATTRAGILVTAGATITNLTVSGPNSNNNKWDEGEFGIKLYYATGATLDGVTVTGANAGIQVNGGSVTMKNTITVSGNEFGGIEVCHGGALNLSAATLVNDGETEEAPTLWNDDTKGTITFSTSQPLSKKIADANKDHYYLSSDKQMVSMGGQNYLSLADAIAEVQNNSTITLLNNNSEMFTVNKVIAFKINANGKTFTPANISAATGYERIMSTESGVTTYKFRIPVTFDAQAKPVNGGNAITYGTTYTVATPTVMEGETLLNPQPEMTVTYYENTGTTESPSWTKLETKPADAGDYKVVIAVKDDNATYAGSKEYPFTIAKADAEAPAAGVGYTIDYAAEKINVTDGYEASTSADFATTLASGTDIVPGTTYYVRKAADANYKASTPTSFTTPARPATPSDMTVLSKSSSTIVMDAGSGLEYSVDGGTTWVDDVSDGTTDGKVTITGLAANTTYNIIARVKATSRAFASGNSEVLRVTTKISEDSKMLINQVSVDSGKIVCGGSAVDVKTASGTDLYAVTAAINKVLMTNAAVASYTDIGLEEATKDSNDSIAAALKAKTDDDTAKGNVKETDISKYLNVKLVSATVDSTDNAVVTMLVFDVTPMATITVTDSAGANVTLTTEITNSEINGTVTFLLPVDSDNTAETAAVYHEGTFLGNYNIKGSAAKYLEVSTSSFSEFGYITLDERTAGAKIDTALYASLADAVSKVIDNQTITLLKDASGTITVSRVVKFAIDNNGKSNTATIVAGEGYTVSQSGNTYSVTVKSSGGHHYSGGTVVQSGNTGDMGIVLYGVLAISSVLGMGWVGRKKHDEE